jgi:hypothetical protein
LERQIELRAHLTGLNDLYRRQERELIELIAASEIPWPRPGAPTAPRGANLRFWRQIARLLLAKTIGDRHLEARAWLAIARLSPDLAAEIFRATDALSVHDKHDTASRASAP